MRWDATTRKPARVRGPNGHLELKALTIACHPDARRIGERVLLPQLEDGGSVRISRGEPDFAAPGRAWGRPPGDPFLSRQPVLLGPGEDGGLVLDASGSPLRLKVDGDEVDGPRHISAQELNDGVVLELAGRLVLVLHLLPESDSEHRESRSRADEMVGESGAMRQVYAAIERVADLKVPVLLRGESGTGKELAARSLHRRGRRAGGPFVAVNLGALPPSLAAAELFGSTKGAFTGAGAGQTGYFRTAEGGTLFLDEIGETPPEVQAMMLRTLETGEVFPLGSQKPHKVDVRLVAATDADLEARVSDGSFKTPLLHRLAAYEIWMPPLRRRKDDIGRLFQLFAEEQLAAQGEDDRLKDFDPEARPWLPATLAARLVQYAWPGNVRQLRNVAHQLVIDSRGAEQLVAGPRVERLLSDLQGTAASSDEVTGSGESRNDSETASNDGSGRSRRRRPAEVPPEELEAALQEHQFEPAAAAKALGISRPSIYYLIRRHPRLQTAEDLDENAIHRALEEHGGRVTEAVAGAARGLKVSARALRRRLGKMRNPEK